MKKLLRKVIFILFELLLFPCAILFTVYLCFVKSAKKRVKIIDKVIDFLINIEQKLEL